MKRNSFSKEKDILRVLRQKPYFSRHLVLKKAASGLADWRYTIIISKKTEKLAVQRNRAKRRLRNIILKYQNKFVRGYDFVFVVSKGIKEIPFLELRKEIDDLLFRSRLLGYEK
jgi:ribonuclease P protein component